MADPIVCSSGCKRALPDIDAASAAGWECLPITGRWRCPECRIELWRVNERFRDTPNTEQPEEAPSHG